jgi:isopentenyl-diphosphate Delta-isomerase
MSDIMSETQQDPTAESRKSDHIELAFASQVDSLAIDTRFSYEPMLSAHPSQPLQAVTFAGKTMRSPIWVSSMTGGTEKARIINRNLAEACAEFGMGMGLGSCRQLLDSDERLPDFDFRAVIGEEQPFYANLGIAQVEQLIARKELWKVDRLIEKLQADGLFIHVNPLQEWLQPEGDIIQHSPTETIAAFLEQSSVKVIVKEVGQGMGKESLRALMKLPVEAIEFAAHGGTNFSKLELLRSTGMHRDIYLSIARIGHSAVDMVALVNELLEEEGSDIRCRQFIVSGGIKNFLDGHYAIEKIQAQAVYGQASGMLKYADADYASLRSFVESQIKGLQLARAFFKVK